VFVPESIFVTLQDFSLSFIKYS